LDGKDTYFSNVLFEEIADTVPYNSKQFLIFVFPAAVPSLRTIAGNI